MLVRTLSLVLFLTACVEDVAKDKAQATIIDSPKTEEKINETEKPTSPAVAANTLNVDIANSSLSALSAKVTATHPIEFPEFKGTVQFDGDELTGVNFEIDMTKLQSDDERLTKHLLNEDFFDVAKYPTSSFKSSGLKKEAGEGGTTHIVTGDLTICGKTKTIAFPATISATAEAFNATSGFAINRQDFGITYKGRADNLIQDNVALTLQFTANR
jgi:polyisoprenoid-binding protein YceI